MINGIDNCIVAWYESVVLQHLKAKVTQLIDDSYYSKKWLR